MKLRYVAVPVLLAALSLAGCATTNTPITPAATVAAATALPTPAPAKTVYVVPSPLPTTQPPTIVVVPPQTVVVQPAGHAPGIGNWYPINSEGSLINVRVNPNTVSGILGAVTQDQYVHIVCTQYGDAVTGPWGTTTLWDYIDYPYYGYVSDMWVNTASGQPVVGSC
jgi:hypothetical protein